KDDQDGSAIELDQVLLHHLIHRRRPPSTKAVVERRVSRTAGRRRGGSIAHNGHPRASNSLLIEAARRQLGGSDAEHGLIEKAETDIGDTGLVLPIDVIERTALRRARPRKG